MKNGLNCAIVVPLTMKYKADCGDDMGAAFPLT